jgi:hypothetical protein
LWISLKYEEDDDDDDDDEEEEERISGNSYF